MNLPALVESRRPHPLRATPLIAALIALVATLFAATGCETTVEDVRKWEKDKRAAEKMKEFIHDEDNSIEVKTEAVLVLTRRVEASNIVPIFKELDAGEREEIAEAVLPHLDEMAEGSQQDAVKAKDAAYYLAKTSIPEELREKMIGHMVEWIDGDNLYMPHTSAGQVDPQMVLEAIGPHALTVLEHAIENKFDKLANAKTDEFKMEMAKKIQKLVGQAEGLKLAETDEMVARVFTKYAEEMYPDLHDVFDLALTENKSEKLKPLAEKIAMDPSYTNKDLNNRKAYVINHYYTKVQPKEGIVVCSKVVREDKTAFLRWMCARTLLKNAGAKGIDHVFLGVPDDPAAHALPKDHPAAEDFVEDDYFWYEAGAFCRSIKQYVDGEVPLDKFRGYLESTRTVERLLAAECLSYYGEPKDIDALQNLPEDVDITAWTHDEAENLKQLGVFLAKEHTKRKDMLAEKKKE